MSQAAGSRRSWFRNRLRHSPLALLAVLAMGAKPCKPAEPTPWPPFIVVFQGDTGQVTIPQGSTFRMLNPCVEPADAIASGPISGTMKVYIERQADGSFLRIDATSANLHAGPFVQGTALVEVHRTALREQKLQLDEATGKLQGNLGFEVATNHGLFGVNIDLAGTLDRDAGTLNAIMTDGSMDCN